MILNPKLLIVDDERGIVDMIQSYFQTQYDILTAYSGQEALKKVACKPDLILLDINMPGMDGLTVCQQIREHIACPILFLTARIESSDKIIGFQAGADDYIVKPFDLDELGARIAAHLRREQRRQNNSAVRFFGELILDYSARTVTINNLNIPLSKREFEIVELLSLNAGQVFDRERIYELVWGLDGDGNSDTIMEHRLQRRNLCRLFCRLPGADKHGQDCKESGDNKDQRRGRYGCTHHRVFKVNNLCHDRKQHPTGKETGDQTNRQRNQREPDRLTVHNALDLPCGSSNRPQQAVLTNILHHRNIKDIVNQQVSAHDKHQDKYNSKHDGL